jgi:DNA gyrase subunit B
MARDAARKSRDLVRNNKGLSEFSLSMATKLAGCTQKDPTKAELFIVEGDSAGGSAKMARNRLFQAVLPLRGKILNVEKAGLNRMLTDEGIRTLIAVMGTGVGETFDITKIRYNKIIIMTDADVDGSHILTLLITFFFRYMRQIIENGYLYVAQPPLYGVKQGQKMSYLLDDKALAEFLLERQLDKITFKDGEELIENGVIREFIKDLFSLASDIKSRGIIAEAFVMAKIGREDQDINDRLIESLNQLKIGKWIYEQREIDTVFVYETNGLIYRYTFNAEKLPVKYFNFIEKWQKFWSADMKMTYNDKPVNTINPMQIYQVFSQKSELHIQRYKGLGEMNPDDLAKTAMQSYLQVTYDNEQEADELIDKLMGDDVEPRKRFIEEMEPLLETDD